MLEEWMKDPGVLRQFAKHYQSGQPIPESLLNSFARADRVGRAFRERLQIWFSQFSLKLHSAQEGTVDPEQLWKETYHDLFHQAVDPEEHGYVSATHWIYYGILEPGSSKPASELVKDFLGRPQRIDAYKRWISEEYAASQ